VPLPEGVIGKEVEATLTNGVLEITARLPSVAATAPHKVEVRDLEKAPATKVTVAA
jgi:HSP20 family molecular chaperone IbpA